MTLKEALIALAIPFLIGCTNQSEHLRNRTVTDKDGCVYLVEIGLGDTVLLKRLKDFKCKPSAKLTPLRSFEVEEI